MHLKLHVTARWRERIEVRGAPADVVQINEKYYVVFTKTSASNQEILDILFQKFSDSDIEKCTLEGHIKNGDPHKLDALFKMLLPDEKWPMPKLPLKSFCQCGSDAVYGINNGAHSHWCMKYKK